MYIRNKKIGSNSYYIIEDRVKIGQNKYITKNVRYLGTALKLLNDLNEFDKLREKKA